VIGISSSGKEQIAATVEQMFDSLALQLIGDIPQLKNAKRLVISSKRNFGLSHLFVQGMKNKVPNEIEADVLKSLLQSAFGYVESLKNRTKSNVTERIDGAIKEAKLRNEPVRENVIQDILAEEMSKAKSQMIAITEAEATKLRNIGTAMDITRVASDLGDSDPTVFFVMVRDGSTCRECLRLHMLSDLITPRVWKMSHLKHGYHKRGEDNPSMFGIHPGCKCVLTYISNGFGFNEQGKVSYIDQDYRAYDKQHK
jgi:hypothetical protein